MKSNLLAAPFAEAGKGMAIFTQLIFWLKEWI